jgi:hypothetical protein
MQLQDKFKARGAQHFLEIYKVLTLQCVCLRQENSIVTSVVRRLLLNFVTRPHVPLNGSSYPIFSDNGEPGVLQRVGSAAGN